MKKHSPRPKNNFKYPFSRFEINDRSMEPSFSEGNRVVTFNWSKFKMGDVVVFKQSNKFFIKTITRISKRKVFIVGDNKKESVNMKPIKYHQVIGKVILKY